MTGHGGWPMTVFLDPDGVPFYGGTYFPPDESRGMPSFRMVMEAVLEAYRRQTRGDPRAGAGSAAAARGARRHSSRARRRPERGGAGGGARRRLLAARRPASTAASAARRSSRPPPRSSCCWPAARPRVRRAQTLDAMLAGGIYDQLGGGFARYAVDRVWLVPHFEKMLYDNGLLARAYLHGWQAFGDERYRRVCEETLDWMLREMRGPEGGFYSALDADSEGEEGKFYVWFPEEIRELARRDARRAGAACSSSTASPRRGNFEGANILHLARRRRGARAARARRGARRGCSRPAPSGSAPGLDDKRLPPGTRWRSRRSPRPARCSAATTTSRRRALRRVRLGARCATSDGPPAPHLQGRRARLNAYLEDHAFLLEALLDPLRSELRAALVTRRRVARRGDDRALRRPRARRLLLDLIRPRGADRAAQGGRRPPDPGRQQRRRPRPAAPRRAERRSAATASAAEGIFALFAQTGDRAPRLLRPPAACARLRTSRGSARWRWSATDADARSSARRPRRRSAPTWSSPPAPRAPSSRRSSPPAPWSTAARPPTSARTSPASCRSPTRTTLELSRRR